MKVSELVPRPEETTAFEYADLNRATDASGCYCLTNASGDVLYVGQAKSVKSRLLQHFDGEKPNTLTIYGRISRAWWQPAAELSLNALERGWLQSIRLNDGVLPPLNRISAPI